jgi:HAMP domain-containing protein
MFRRIQSVSFSIGQLTFGSFTLLLAMIAMTSIASVVAIRHIDATFAELQHLQSLGEAAEEIDRRTKELRLAARDFVTDPAAPSGRVQEAAASLSTLLKNTRLQLVPEQQAMIDGVTQRLANYQEGMDRITSLISRRAELVSVLPPVRARFEQAISDIPERATARELFRAQNRLTAALLGHDIAATEQSARVMKSLKIDDAALRVATDAYADAVLAISSTEDQIGQLDREVLGAEGQMISRVTDLLRDLGDRRGRVLARDFARTLARDKWQSILLGIAGVMIGLAAALFVVRQTVRPLKAIATAIHALAGGEKETSIPATGVHNEIGDIARAAEVFRRSLVDADAAREAAIRALAE